MVYEHLPDGERRAVAFLTVTVKDRLQFVGLTGLTAPALLGWGLRVIVCAWSVSVWVGLKDRLQNISQMKAPQKSRTPAPHIK